MCARARGDGRPVAAGASTQRRGARVAPARPLLTALSLFLPIAVCARSQLEHKEFKPKNPVKALRCAADYWAAPRGNRKYCPPADWLELACNATLESGLADDGGGRAEDLKGLPSIVVETACVPVYYDYYRPARPNTPSRTTSSILSS